MTLNQLIARAIDTARAGQTPEAQAQLSTMEAEVETLLAQSLHDLATMTARDSRRRHLLTKQFELTLATDTSTGSQYAELEDEMLSDYICYGTIRNPAELSSQSEALGEQFEHIQHFTDFARPLPEGFPFYCVHNNRFYFRGSSGTYTDTNASLWLECPYVPTITEVPVVLEDDLVKLVANALVGMVNAKAA